MSDRNCTTCNYCRMDTDAESVAMYGRALGYGTCYGSRPGETVKAPKATLCDRYWSPLENPSFLPSGAPNRDRNQEATHAEP